MIEAIREWAARHTAQRRYSPVGQAFHWIMAILVTVQLGWGWHMSRVPVGPLKADAYQLHADLGLLMLVLAMLRLIWRAIVPGPVNDADDLGWQTRAAYLTHALFYICFFGLPLSGWMMWSALGSGDPPLALAGIIPWPHMPFQSAGGDWQWLALDWAEGVHALLVLLLVVMIPLHVGAALKHHFWDKHDVLEGMLPELDADKARDEPRHGLPGDRSSPAAKPG